MGFFKSGRLILLFLLPAALFARGAGEGEENPSSQSPLGETPPEPVLLGGYQSIPLDSAIVLRAEEELHSLWTGEERDWENAILLKAESQAVAGKKIRLTYENLPGYEGAILYYPPDGSNPTATWIKRQE
ncbi:MAG: hypothetical protein PQJ60_13460 [Spirochaetales bacterium]|nr:hypothetical protein [Spirochaetales bacterium]